MDESTTALRVLVVEQTFDTRRRIIEQLSETGATVRGCDPLYTVVDMVFRLSDPHWVVVDPGPSDQGYGLIEKLRKLGPSTRLIVLAFDGSHEFRQRALALGADYFFDKGTEFDSAIALIAEAAEAP